MNGYETNLIGISLYNLLMMVVVAAALFYVAQRRRAVSLLAMLVIVVAAATMMALTIGMLVMHDRFGALRLLGHGVFCHLTIALLGCAALLWRTARRTAIASLALVGVVSGIGIDAYFIEPQWLEVTHHRIASSKIKTPITIAVLKGILESVREGVNMVNATSVAQEIGLKVIESKVTLPKDFASLVSVRVRGCEDRLIAGTIFHGGQPRIVRIDDFMLEAIPEGPTIFIQNHDEAGVVGNVGTILGEGGLNISRMQLALLPDRKQAAMLVNVDAVPSEEIMERLRRSRHMITAQLVEL